MFWFFYEYILQNAWSDYQGHKESLAKHIN
jgi:hypothetical protein